MNIRFWGVRGSIPSPGPETLKYGGNTSCMEVLLHDGTRVIVDAGSGIRPLGVALGPCDATLILSHYHWDHIQGMPFFGPSYLPDSSIQVLGPEVEQGDPVDLLSRQMLAPYFPAPASQWLGIVNSQCVYAGEPFVVGSSTVRAAYMSHPGPTFGYRFEDHGQTLVYMSDNEVDNASPELLAGIIDLAAGADLLIHDCQYFESEYRLRRGWGHSTPRQVLRLAHEASVKSVVLFHHDPGHTDDQVEALAEEARQLAGSIAIMIGREGELIDIANIRAPRPRLRQRKAV
jgi:phosphoribosyl 1,2-cyclic phosphodiesterase